MSDAKKCDRCGKQYEADSSADILFVYQGFRQLMRYELCFDCVNDVVCVIEKVEENV